MTNSFLHAPSPHCPLHTILIFLYSHFHYSHAIPHTTLDYPPSYRLVCISIISCHPCYITRPDVQYICVVAGVGIMNKTLLFGLQIRKVMAPRPFLCSVYIRKVDFFKHQKRHSTNKYKIGVPIGSQ